MRLPKPLYEALPLFYVIAGSALVLGIAYLRVVNTLTLGVGVLGLLCIFLGLHIKGLRVAYRRRFSRPNTAHLSALPIYE